MKPALACLLLALCSTCVRADPVLPARAFVDPPTCKVDPYTDPNLEQRERRLKTTSDCATRFALNSSAKSSLTQRPRVELEKNVAYRLDDLSFNFSLAWAGWRDNLQSRSRTERATWAGGAKLGLGPGWALDSTVGRDVRTGQRMRGTLSSLWQPQQNHTTFLQWAAEPAGLARMAGWRWWAVPNKVSLDMTVIAPPASAPLQPRLGFSILDL